MEMLRQVARSKSARIAAGLLAVDLLAGCPGQPQDVNENSAKSKGVKIHSAYRYDKGGHCTARTDSAKLRIGQFVVLGEYDTYQQGWKISHPAANRLVITEGPQDTDTFFNRHLPHAHQGDLKWKKPTPVTLPPFFDGLVAEYWIRGRDNSRQGEAGSFDIVTNKDNSVRVSILSHFDVSSELDQAFCGPEHVSGHKQVN